MNLNTGLRYASSTILKIGVLVCFSMLGLAISSVSASELSNQFEKHMRDGNYDDAELLIDAGMLEDSDRKSIRVSRLFRNLVVKNGRLLVSDSDAERIHGILSKIDEVQFEWSERGSHYSLSYDVLNSLIDLSKGGISAQKDTLETYEKLGLGYDTIPDRYLYDFMTELFRPRPDIGSLVMAEAESRGMAMKQIDRGTGERLLVAASKKAIENRRETLDFFLNEKDMLRHAEFSIVIDDSITNLDHYNVFNSFASSLGGMWMAYGMDDGTGVDASEAKKLWYEYYCNLADRFYHTKDDLDKYTMESESGGEPFASYLEYSLFYMINANFFPTVRESESCGGLISKMMQELEDPRVLAKRLAEAGNTDGMKWVLEKSAK